MSVKFYDLFCENYCLPKIAYCFIFDIKKQFSCTLRSYFQNFFQTGEMKSFLIITIITVISSVNSQTFDANAYCSTLPSSLYPYPGGTDCTQYVKCFSNGVSMVGAVYTCMGTTLFNPAQMYCQSGYVCVPATSTTLVPSTSSTSTTP